MDKPERYINPWDCTKEEWLKKYTLVLPHTPEFEDVPDTHRLVCLVHNSAFTAARVAWTLQDYEHMIAGMGGRCFSWHLVHRQFIDELQNAV